MKFSPRAPPPVPLLVAVAWLLAIGQLPGGTAVQINRTGKTCQEYPVETREEKANVVISGYIQRIMRKPRTILYDCDVEVVRVFKGYEELHDEVEPPMQGNIIQVGGFGDPMICDNTVTPGDTRIFMVNKNGNGHLMLNSSVIRITLNNLVQAEAAVFDIPFVTRKPERRGPCDMVLCIFGATCIENEMGRPQCVCDRKCPDIVAPVCGSDGVTYASECLLKKASCQQKRRISLKSQGDCEERDPCQDIQCNFGGECVIEGDTASCICPDICLLDFDPVCGSDGVTYSNDCQLKAAACHQQTEITVQSTGQCVERDPCDNVTCNFGASCIAEGNEGVCICPEICLDVQSPVCGSDGVDYGNECELNVSACSQGKNITVIFQGSCDPCRDIQYETGVCKLDRSRQPSPGCEFDCSAELSTPVCGSDGMTYENECELTRSSCLSNLENLLIVFTEGVCEMGSHPCEDQMCEFGLCLTDSAGVPQCVCVGCPDIYVPVCGSDGVTYHSQCHLELASCNKEVLITVVEEGTCRQEQVITCSTPACEATEGALTPVCGTDDVDYPSLCALQQAACDQDKTIEVASNGYCDKCNEVECILGASCQMRAEGPTCVCSDHCEMVNMPVCGSDGETYASECKLHVIACTNQKNITVVSYGSCDDCLGVTCRTEDYNEVCYQGVCVCQESCALARAEEDNVCGTDGKTYDTLCALQAEACVSQSNLSVDSYGPCENNCRGVVCNTELFNEVCYYGLCVCQESCPASRSEEDNVCGTDDETYDTICHLKAAACRSQSNLTVESHGPCESSGSGSGTIPPEIIQVCDDVTCGFGGICRPLSAEDHQCVCNFNCPAVRSPVCGTDGVTYGNDCQRREASCEQQTNIILERVGTCEDIEIEPCDGESPLVREGTTDHYTCNEDNRGEDCPSGSYCHIHPLGRFSVCCPVNIPGNATRPCLDSEFGCCPDNETEALGDNYEGCPSKCSCNELGSYSKYCEPVTEQCPCKPGIGGKNCDRCEPGFYDFLALEQNSAGCKPCGCNVGGSRRDDCDQTTGVCSCKRGVDGDKCNICPSGQVMTPTGCVTEEMRPEVDGITCMELTCRFYAQCVEGAMPGQNATCVCPNLESCANENIPVCGDNNMAYGSRCQLEVVACREQKNLMVKYEGACETTVLTPTPPQSHCQQAQWGCCHDNQTLATGPDGAGCEHLTEGTTPQAGDAFGRSSATELRPTTNVGAMATTAGVTDMVTDGVTVSTTLVATDGSLSSTVSGSEASTMNGSTNGIAATANNIVGSMVSTMAPTAGTTVSTMASTAGTTISTMASTASTTVSTMASTASTTVSTMASTASTTVNTMGSTAGATVSSTVGSIATTVGTTASSATTTATTSAAATAATTKVFSTSSTTTTSATTTFSTTLSVSPFVTTTYTTDSVIGTTTQEVMVFGCDSSPCQHGGTCRNEAVAPGFSCDCPVGKGGPVCNKAVSFDTPSFSGDSYLAFASMDGFFDLEIIIEFQTNSTEGVLLYNAQNDEGTGDFVSLAIVDNQVEFRFLSTDQSNGFDLGRADPVVIRSTVELEPMQWHMVRAYRSRRDGTISVDEEPEVTGSSSGASGALNLGEELFIGHAFPPLIGLKLANTSNGFIGCIRNVEINSKVLDLSSANLAIEYGANVGECGHDPCKELPCLNNGTCEPVNAETYRCVCMEPYLGPKCGDVLADQCEGNMCYVGSSCVPLPEGGYRCDCQEGWKGELCSEEIPPDCIPTFNLEDTCIPAFSGNSYIEFPSLRIPRQFVITVEFYPTSSDGMVFYNGQKDTGNGDFVSLNLRAGYLEFRFDLGRGIADIRSPKVVELNEWHVVRVMRRDSTSIQGEMVLDNLEPVFGTSPAGASELNLARNLFVGGSSNYNQLSRKASITDGFEGAIRTFVVDGVTLDLQELVIASINVDVFTQNTMDTTATPDPSKMTTTMASVRRPEAPILSMTSTPSMTTPPVVVVDVNAPVRFDGQTSFQYYNGITRKQRALRNNIIQLSFKTDQPNGAILWNGVGTADFQAIGVSEGFAEFAYNLGKGKTRIRSENRVDDNRWHTVVVTRNLADASLQVDDNFPVMGQARPGASQLDTNGILVLGRGERVPNSMSSSYTYFTGCIANVLLDENRMHLYENAQGEKPSQFCQGP